ncbi:hypothetical protein B0H12DRAFT_1117767 [Mycena haematopus]|nr:hypothetical protein B0H12DRAFT_1117767 [Mycena haematopus]
MLFPLFRLFRLLRRCIKQIRRHRPPPAGPYRTISSPCYRTDKQMMTNNVPARTTKVPLGIYQTASHNHFDRWNFSRVMILSRYRESCFPALLHPRAVKLRASTAMSCPSVHCDTLFCLIPRFEALRYRRSRWTRPYLDQLVFRPASNLVDAEF